MDDEEDGPPMLVSSDVVDDVDASLNAEMADAQIKKVPISIITGTFHLPMLLPFALFSLQSV
jgi:hypothetical protein